MSSGGLSPLAKIALSACISIGALVSLELGLRALGIPDPGLYDGDPASVWWLRPGMDRDVPFPAEDRTFHVTTNALGLRGPLPPDTGPWTLVLGCSTTFGWGVEDDEAWPARLDLQRDEPVINGGMPGWSTVQARLAASRWLDLHPTHVILSYIVRDAWPASTPDAQRRPSHWLMRTHFAQLVLSMRGASSPASSARSAGETFRVPPDQFEANLRALVSAAGDAEVTLLAFPSQDPSPEWIERMQRVGPTLTPALSAADYFLKDPVHLNATGHQALADYVARALKTPPG